MWPVRSAWYVYLLLEKLAVAALLVLRRVVAGRSVQGCVWVVSSISLLVPGLLWTA